MELSPSVLQGLEAAGSSTLADGAFKILVTSAAQGALGKDGTTEKLQGTLTTNLSTLLQVSHPMPNPCTAGHQVRANWIRRWQRRSMLL